MGKPIQNPQCTEINRPGDSGTGGEKTEIIEASGHKTGDWEIVKKSGLLTKGEKQKVCEKCGEVLESETINSIIPIWVVVIVVVLIIVGAVSAFIYRKKHK